MGLKVTIVYELSVYQWSQGFIQCVLEKQNSKIKENMMKHFVSIIQDAFLNIKKNNNGLESNH